MEYLDITYIVAFAVIALIFLFIKYVAPLLKEKIGEAKLQNIAKYVKIAVGAAEMIFVEQGTGAAKKDYVINYLVKKGLTIDFETLDNLIEDAVLEMNLKKNEAITWLPL